MESENKDKLDVILDKLVTLVTKIKDFETQQTDSKSKVTENIETIKQENNLLKTTIQQQNSKISNLELQIQSESKRNNILIYNLQIHPANADIETQILFKLNKLLKVNISYSDVNFIKILGKNSKGPILISLMSWKKKLQILRDKYRVKTMSNVIIKSDLPLEIRERRRKLWMLKTKKKIVGVVKYDKLIVNGKAFTLEQLEEEEAHKKRNLSNENENNDQFPQNKSLNSSNGPIPNTDQQENNVTKNVSSFNISNAFQNAIPAQSKDIHEI